MKSMLAFALAFGALAAAPASARAEMKIGYVDLERAMAETNEGKNVIAKLKGDFEKKQKELDARSGELKKLKEDLDKQKTILNPGAAAAKDQELQQKLAALQETFMRLQQDLQKRQAEEMSRMLKKMGAVIQTISENEKLTFMFNKSDQLPVILWAPPSLDYTNDLIRRYNNLGAK